MSRLQIVHGSWTMVDSPNMKAYLVIFIIGRSKKLNSRKMFINMLRKQRQSFGKHSEFRSINENDANLNFGDRITLWAIILCLFFLKFWYRLRFRWCPLSRFKMTVDKQSPLYDQPKSTKMTVIHRFHKSKVISFLLGKLCKLNFQ